MGRVKINGGILCVITKSVIYHTGRLYGHARGS